ncbi:MAG: hypothetical protein JXA42_13000 [Anaerolineales bacterium]|nr:hypothetical protein [Anaerolineales bacterium]
MMCDKPVLGIMLLDTQFPRIPGDIGNADSYPFPTRLMTVPSSTVERAVFQADPTLLELFVSGAHQLEAEGVCAITSSCGFLSPLQEQVSKAVSVPVFMSSLIQVPIVYAITQKPVAILSASKDNLTPFILASAGIESNVPYVIGGLERLPAFHDTFLSNDTSIDKTEIQSGVIQIAGELIDERPDIGSFVLECHNLAPYGKALFHTFGKPVFDIISFAVWVYDSIVKRGFPDP